VTTTEQALAEFIARFGARWQIWYVPHALDGGVTCVRANGTPTTSTTCTPIRPPSLRNTLLKRKPSIDGATGPRAGDEGELLTFRFSGLRISVQDWPRRSIRLLSDLGCTPIDADVRRCMRLRMRLSRGC
jgi:hypothetical protein